MATKQADHKKVVPVERKSRFSTAVDEDAMEFIRAIELYKKTKGRAFPAWTEVLQVLKALGYRKVAEPGPLPSGPPDETPDEDG